MKTKENDEIGAKISNVLNSIFGILTFICAICVVFNLGGWLAGDAVDVLTPLLYTIGFGAITLITRSKE